VGPDQDPLVAIGMPGDEQVFDMHRFARAPVANLEGLPGDRPSGGAKVLREQGPLPPHRLRPARSRPQGTDRLEVGKGPLA